MVVTIKKYDLVNCYRAVVLMREIIELNNEPIISNYREYAPFRWQFQLNAVARITMLCYQGPVSI